MDLEYREIDTSDWDQIEPLLQELHYVHHDLRPSIYAERTTLQRSHYEDSFFGVG